MLIMFDVEADGPIPGDYSMISFAAVLCKNKNENFYVTMKPISDKFIPDALKVSGFNRDETLKFENPEIVMKKTILIILLILLQTFSCNKQKYYKPTDVKICNIQKINEKHFAFTNLIHPSLEYGIYISFEKKYYARGNNLSTPQMLYAAIEPGLGGSKEKITNIKIYLYNSLSDHNTYYITDYLYNYTKFQLKGDMPISNSVRNLHGYDFKSIKDFITKFNMNSEDVQGISLANGDGFVLWLPYDKREILKQYKYVMIKIEMSDGTILKSSTDQFVVY